jgi:hypothetical protein
VFLADVHNFFVDNKKFSDLEMYPVYVTGFNELAFCRSIRKFILLMQQTRSDRSAVYKGVINFRVRKYVPQTPVYTLYPSSLTEARGTQLFAPSNTAFQTLSRESVCAWV